jgi:hypothetical protein
MLNRLGDYATAQIGPVIAPSLSVKSSLPEADEDHGAEFEAHVALHGEDVGGGVSVFRCFGVSVFRCFGVSVFRCFGVSVAFGSVNR